MAGGIGYSWFDVELTSEHADGWVYDRRPGNTAVHIVSNQPTNIGIDMSLTNVLIHEGSRTKALLEPSLTGVLLDEDSRTEAVLAVASPLVSGTALAPSTSLFPSAELLLSGGEFTITEDLSPSGVEVVPSRNGAVIPESGTLTGVIIE